MTGREAERRDILQMLNDELELVEAHNLLFGSVQLREIIKQIEEGKHTRKRGTLDLDAIRNRHLRLSQMAGKTFCTGHVLMDLADCIGEIEQLRAENAVLTQTSADLCVVCGWRFFVHGEGCQGCLVEQLRKDIKRYVAEERAAVVAWLRERQPGWPAGSGGHADAIENGEHRREEER